MNEMKLSCEIVKDLIPLCSEGIGSPESMAEVEAHIKTCERCRKLYEQIPPDTIPVHVPEEKNVFQKLGSTLRRNRMAAGVLTVILLMLVGILLWLTVGQVQKKEGMRSFETIWQSVEVRQIVQKVAAGDMQWYAAHTSYGDLNSSNILINSEDAAKIRQADADALQKAYDAAYGGDKVKSVKVETSYADYGMNSVPIPYTRASLHYEDGKVLELHFIRGGDGLYQGSVVTTSGEAGNTDLRAVMERMICHDVYPLNLLSGFLRNETPTGADSETIRAKTRIFIDRLGPDCRDGMEERFSDFYGKGYLVEDLQLSPIRYDKERKMLYNEVTFLVRDAQGSAVLLTRFWSEAEGLRFAPGYNEIYPKDCSEELAEDMQGLFG